MSNYTSTRRRFSEPEKPQPRFEWRMRVHSLMMDDSEKENCDTEKRVVGSDRSRAVHDLSSPDHHRTHRPVVDPLESHRERRERYSRTKSEGHLKLRLRLSKYSDYSRSHEEEGSMGVDSYPEYTGSENKHAPTVAKENMLPDQENENGAIGGCDPPQPVCQETYSKYEQYEGATPNRCPSSDVPNSEEEVCDYNNGQSQNLFGKRSVNGWIAESPNNPRPETQDPPNITNTTIHDGLHGPPNTSQAIPAHHDDCRQRSESGSDNSGLEDGASGIGEPSGENKVEIDDIETIIERLIAEEEAMTDGRPASPELVRASLKHLSEGGMAELQKQVDELREKVDDCNKEAEYGIWRDNKRSSSLPSQDRDGFSQVKAVMPYSSSCPHTTEVERDVKKAEDDGEEEECELDSWAYLPVILIEDIFTLLTPKERHQASQVCRQWYDLFYSPRVWETFILLERTLTKKRFNLYKGYQRELCPGKTQLCFRRVGSFFKRIVVTPITDYFNLYEFLRILAAFLQFQEDHGQIAMPLLHTFDFTFACASRSEGVEMVHGTGGQILEMIKQLLVRMSNLKHLKLNQLLIDVTDVPPLFDAITNCFGESLSSLELLNVSKVPLALPELARFRNLVKLSVSPQHLNEEVLLMLAGLNIMQLFLVQDPYTCECEPVSSEAWKLMHEMAPWLHVYLEVSGRAKSKVLIQPRAPVHGVFLRTPYTRLTNDLVMSLVEHYSKTLRYFVQERLPRVHGPRGFNFRCDSSLLFLVRRCRSLHTLIIRERISTATLILVANEGRRLSTLLARKYGLIKRCDWLRCGEMSKDFYAHLKRASLNYDECTDEVCRLLQRRWRPLTDRQFMRLKIVPRLQVF